MTPDSKLTADEVSVIITCYNQSRTVSMILDALAQSTMLPGEILVMNNGSNDDTEQQVRTHLINQMTSVRHEYKPKASTFKLNEPGFCDVIPARNLAYELASQETLISIDGDCIPAENLVESYIDMYNLLPNTACAFVGMRLDTWPREVTLTGVRRYIEAVSSLTDYRSDLYGLFSEESQFEKLDFTALTVHSCFWSCNYSVRKSSCREVHTLLHQLKPKRVTPYEIYDLDFDGTWGSDDAFFGACLYYSGTVVLTNRLARVYHIDHPSRHNHRNEALFYQKLDRLRLLYQQRIMWNSAG